MVSLLKMNDRESQYDVYPERGNARRQVDSLKQNIFE